MSKTEWEKVKLGEICNSKSSNISQNKIQHLGGAYPIFGASGYLQNVDFYKQEKPYIGIVKDGAGVGRVMLLPAKSSILGTLQYIIPNDKTDINFLFYTLNKLNLAKYASGATIPHIYFRDYSNEKVYLPSINHQRHIAVTLDKANELITLRKKQLEELDAFAEAVFYDMFGDPVKNEKGWKFKNMMEFSDVTSSKRIFANEYISEGIPFYRSKEIAELGSNKEISIELFISEKKYDNIKQEFGIPTKGDILIAAIGATIGKMWVVDNNREFYFKDGNIIWIKNKGFIPIFLKRVLLSMINGIKDRLTNGGAYPALTIITLKNMDIIYPPLPLQSRFATIIEKIEEQKAQVRKALQESEDLFQRLMQDLFKTD